MAGKWRDLKKTMSPAAKARVDSRVRATLERMPLAEIRRAIGLTQTELAQRRETGQGSVSKLEGAADMYLPTLRKHVEALGGELHVTARFKDGRELEIEQIFNLAQVGHEGLVTALWAVVAWHNNAAYRPGMSR